MKQYYTALFSRSRKTNILVNFLNLSGIQISNTLLIILLIPVITRKIGIEEFGIIMFASRFAQLTAAIINYGTGQSGVRDVAMHATDHNAMRAAFYNTLVIKATIFLIYLVVLAGLYTIKFDHYHYILLSTPMVLAEVFNPLFFFIGIEKLRVFNLANVAGNALCILAILLFIKGPADAAWINFIIGSANAILYLALVIYGAFKFKLKFKLPTISELISIAISNFYLTVNNISVHLQQSMIIFALEHWGTTAVLGAYSICDRIIGQCRNVLITISNAIYPNAVHIFKEGPGSWAIYKKRTRYFLSGLFLVGSVLLFVLADLIIFILTKEHNATAVLFLRIMAIVPTLSALNVLNVLDQLLKNLTVNIFRVALVLLIISAIVVTAALNLKDQLWIGAFTVITELCALIMFEYLVNRSTVKYA